MHGSPPRSIVGGFVFPRPGRSPEWGFFQWPLGKLIATDEQLLIGPRGALARFKKPFALHFSEIERIETRALPRWPLAIIVAIRFRLADPAFDRTMFWSWRGSVDPVLEALNAAGIAIERSRRGSRRAGQ